MKSYKFKNVISLGHFCDVAQELERKGYRSFSLPFDWLITDDFSALLSLIDNNFGDFLDANNLLPDPVSPKYYYDPVYKIRYYHDFNAYQTKEEQLPKVKSKYRRRIDRLYEVLSQPTIMIRYCVNGDEVMYVNEHRNDIELFFKRYNPMNECLFISQCEHADTQFVNGGGVCY